MTQNVRDGKEIEIDKGYPAPKKIKTILTLAFYAILAWIVVISSVYGMCQFYINHIK